jgi:hypothetical protein
MLTSSSFRVIWASYRGNYAPQLLQRFFRTHLLNFHSLPITIVEFGDIYLTVTSFTNFSTSLRRIDFSEFWEVPHNLCLDLLSSLHSVKTVSIVGVGAHRAKGVPGPDKCKHSRPNIRVVVSLTR